MRDVERSCRHCGDAFVVTVDEQRELAAREFALPGHCPPCRAARRAAGAREREGAPGEPPREEVDAVCAACGEPTKLPFEPRSTRPVYCAACFRNR